MDRELIQTLVDRLFAVVNDAQYAPNGPVADESPEALAAREADNDARQAAQVGALAEAISAVVPGMTPDQIIAGLRDAAGALLAEGGSQEQQLQAIETAGELAQVIDIIRGVQAAADAAAEQIVAARTAAEQALGITPTEPASPDGGGDDGAETPDGRGETETPDENALAAGDGATPENTPPAAPARVTREPVPVPSLAALERLRPADTRPQVQDAAPILARARLDVPDYNVGQVIPDLEALGNAITARQEFLGRSSGGTLSEERVPVARFDYKHRLRMLSPEDAEANLSAIADARDLDRSLTASGGFCAPAEIVYGFVKINEPDGLVQSFLPTLGAPRGQVQFPTSPDIRTAFTANPSRTYTLTNDTNADTKAVTTIACPANSTCHVDAQYEILKFGNLNSRAYPEWVQHWVSLTSDVHQHKVSSKLMNQILGFALSPVPVGPNAGATATILSNLSLAVADYRSDLRMRSDAPLEVIMPIWVPDLIRSDLARSHPYDLDAAFNLPTSKIVMWMQSVGINVRFVTDWQTVSGDPTTGAAVWPGTLSFVIYAPGTFVKLDMGTLDLGVVRDSTLNTTNDYNLFSESYEGVCKPGIEARTYTAQICVDGSFGRDVHLDCHGIGYASGS